MICIIQQQLRQTAAPSKTYSSYPRLMVLIIGFMGGVGLMAYSAIAGTETSQTTNGSANLVFNETRLCHLPTAGNLLELQVSPDNGHLAYSYLLGTNLTGWLDGVQLGAYDEVRDFQFSPDSRHLAYVGRRGSEVWLIQDCQQGKAYDDIGTGCVVFSGDSEHIVYIARRGSHWLAVHDGKEGNGYDRIGRTGIVLSHDGRHLAYSVIQKKQNFTVVDGQEGIPCDGMGTFNFSPDGQHFGYVVPRGGKWVVVLDGNAEEY